MQTTTPEYDKKSTSVVIYLTIWKAYTSFIGSFNFDVIYIPLLFVTLNQHSCNKHCKRRLCIYYEDDTKVVTLICVNYAQDYISGIQINQLQTLPYYNITRMRSYVSYQSQQETEDVIV